jgi:hypothetical protein
MEKFTISAVSGVNVSSTKIGSNLQTKMITGISGQFS